MPDKLSNIDVEKGLIGATFMKPEKVILHAVNHKKILPSCFHNPTHAIIWKTMLDMYEDDKAIDVITLSENLHKNGLLDKVGGTIYLNGLLDNAPIAEHAEYYMDLLLEWQTTRYVAELSASLKEAISQNNLEECKRINELIRGKIDGHFTITKEDDRFPAWRYDDLVAYKVPEGHIIAGKGWLRRGCGCLLTGGTSLGKSVLAEQIAVSVASGVRILESINVPSPMKVTYLQAENDEETLQRDIVSIVEYLKADPKLVQQNLAIHHLYGLSGMALDSWIEREIVKQKTDLLMLDPYQDFIPSGSNINDAGTFLTFIFNINRIIKEHNCAFLLVTHTPKPQDRDHWTARESVYMAVGSQAIAAWARTSAELTGYKDDDTKYRLRFGKNAERNGIAQPDGGAGLVRDLMIQHSPSIHHPYWQVPTDQSEPDAASEMGKKIIMMANEHPSYSYAKIAEELKCSKSVVGKWFPRKKEG